MKLDVDMTRDTLEELMKRDQKTFDIEAEIEMTISKGVMNMPGSYEIKQTGEPNKLEAKKDGSRVSTPTPDNSIVSEQPTKIKVNTQISRE